MRTLSGPNLWLRTCDRVMLVMDRFEARSFEELFQGVKKLPWEKLIPSDGAFPVRARCVRSQIMSPSDVQKITKKAMVERLKQAYGVDWFRETGAAFQVDVSIRGDVVTVCVDSSGEALSKRGYRTWNGEAPLRETLAAALVLQSGWHPKEPLYDPCCGTGTLLIEAAFHRPEPGPGAVAEICHGGLAGGGSRAACEAVRREAREQIRPVLSAAAARGGFRH